MLDVPRHQQMPRLGRGQSPLVFNIDQRVLDLPDHRPLLAIFDAPTLPSLITQRRIAEQVFDVSRRRTARHEPRRLAATPATASAIGPCGRGRSVDPGRKMLVNLADERLPTPVQCPQKLRLAAVPFVERDPFELHAVVRGALVQFQSDVALGSIHDLVGDTRLPAASAIVRPAFWNEQIVVDQAVKVAAGITQMHGDDAVLLLADGPAVLPLHARRFLAFLDEASLVNQANGMLSVVIAHHDLLHAVPHSVVVPLMLTEEFLQSSDRHVGLERHRLDALTWQIGKLSLNVGGKMGPSIAAGETVRELRQEFQQLRSQLANLFGIHAISLLGEWHRFAVFPKPHKINLAL